MENMAAPTRGWLAGQKKYIKAKPNLKHDSEEGDLHLTFAAAAFAAPEFNE